jgi:hypothetical protein
VVRLKIHLKTKMATILKCRNLSQIIARSSYCSIKYFSSSASADPQKPHYDVIIAGGGLVGVSLAVSLGKISFVY